MDGHLTQKQADCQARLEALFGYLDGELSAARCRQIERHLDACPCCGHLAVRLRRAIAVCRAAGRSTLPPDVRRQAGARIAQLLGSTAAPSKRAARTRPGGRGPASDHLQR